ncbi:MAG: SDR family oxidoreductase [Candidatus Protistobacter heckmanni]|nr:SDR family oxidoreductase [Candidatus Protistobacter heckmanni]
MVDSSKASSSKPSRLALVTGAARRLGRAISLELARQGWDVAVHCHRSRAEAEEVAAEIRALGRKSVVLQADLSDEAQATGLIGRCVEAIGLPACLVNNASIFQYDAATSFSYAAFDAAMRANAAAPILLARELYRATPAKEKEDGGAQGVVINMLDQKLSNLNPDFFSYTLSKAALQAATTMMAQTLTPRLRVVGVAPGATLVSGNQTQEDFAKAHKIALLGRSSRPADIAGAVCYLANAEAVTGVTLAVDGGQHLMHLPRDVMFLTE